MGHRGYINSAIPKISTNYVPKVTKYSAHKSHLQNRLIPYIISGSEDMNGCDTSYNIYSYSKYKDKNTRNETIPPLPTSQDEIFVNNPNIPP